MFMKKKMTRSQRAFHVTNTTLLILVSITMIFPVLYVVKMSMDTGAADTNGLSLIPREFSTIFYEMILNKPFIFRSLLNTILITIVGTALSLIIESMGAYTLSRRDIPGHRFFTYMLIIPMMFSGGIIPLFLTLKQINLIDSFWVLILPSCVSGWNMILIRNYYWSIPESLKEAARIDGASEFRVFYQIIIPLAKPVLAAIGLFTLVGFWNSFYNALMFITSTEKYTFQLVLREMINNAESKEQELLQMGLSAESLKNVSAENLAAAMIVVSIVPIIIVYPFIQKHFTKGIMVGSVKG